ncbi:MAG TPA: DegV family protein, partial [Clostridia bacterium]|nr:DegV family protein [Clostridia bacterium]
MSSYVITCGSTADLPHSYVTRRQIPYLCYRYSIGDQEHLDDLWQSVTSKEFYQRMDRGAMPVTTQVNVAQYLEFFEPFLQQGKDVLHVEFSSGLSGSCQSALMARDELAHKYPDRQVLVVDTLAASSGYGLLVDAACDLRDSGAGMQEIYGWLTANRLTAQHWFFSTDLTHYKRGGRISASAAVIGTLLNICPLMFVNAQGKLIPHSKLRGRRNAV